MARPKKTNASYFSHDTDMRNDLKIKALRRKFGHKGYSVWNMLLEIITDSDNLELEYNDGQIELISADFDMDSEELRPIVDYCLLLRLLVNNSGFLYSETLKKRLEAVFQKRNRQLSTAKTPINGVNDVDNPKNGEFLGVIDDDNRQIKEKEKKLNEIKEKENKHSHEDGDLYFLDSELHLEILKYFNFSEMRNPDKLSTLFTFLNILNSDGRIEQFKVQFEAYKTYKDVSKETVFGFGRFLGTMDVLFVDGGWNAENWTAKLEGFNKKAGTMQGESIGDYNRRILKQIRAEA